MEPSPWIRYSGKHWRRTVDGFYVGAPPEDLMKVFTNLGLERSKGCPTPAVRGACSEGAPFSGEQARLYRTVI
eukprot:7223567-Heterocapsa_arctica.AAC.1